MASMNVLDLVARAMRGDAAVQQPEPAEDGLRSRLHALMGMLPQPVQMPAMQPAPITPEYGRQRAREAVAQAMAAPSGAQIQDQLAGTRRFWEA